MMLSCNSKSYFQKYNEEVVKFLEHAGFGKKVFWNSPRLIYQGADCEWPSEEEVFARRYVSTAIKTNRF